MHSIAKIVLDMKSNNHFAQKFVRGVFENSLISVEAAAITHQKY